MFRKIYFRRLIYVAVIAVISALFTYLVVFYFDRYPIEGFRSGFLESYVTHFVFIVGLISYSIISVALMNCVTLFSMSQPEMASRAVLISLVANIIVGFVLSRWFNYYYSIFGLLVGSIVFLILSSRKILELFRNLDYYIYFQS